MNAKPSGWKPKCDICGKWDYKGTLRDRTIDGGVWHVCGPCFRRH